jgi:hypothetical protein
MTGPGRVATLGWAAVAVLLAGSCAYRLGMRHFAGPTIPGSQQVAQMSVSDDNTVTYRVDRLEIRLRPFTVEMLDRKFDEKREGFYQLPPNRLTVNPFTFGAWSPPEGKRAPERFTVFLLQIQNYAFPKVLVDSRSITLESGNGRTYSALRLSALMEYYYPYAVAYAGNTYQRFEERADILRRAMYQDEMVFSGQEAEGFLIFPPLHTDVSEFTVWLRAVTLRFDYRDEPVEAVDIPYRFSRDVYLATQPRG